MIGLGVEGFHGDDAGDIFTLFAGDVFGDDHVLGILAGDGIGDADLWDAEFSPHAGFDGEFLERRNGDIAAGGGDAQIGGAIGGDVDGELDGDFVFALLGVD